MTLVTFRQMVGAQLLALTRRRAVLGLAAFFTIGIVTLYFGVSAIEHASNSVAHEPAGGMHPFERAVDLLSVFFGSLAAILIGIEAGVGDAASGVFRELVSTGRPRLWLFAVRLPAALLVTLAFALAAMALAIVATVVFAGGTPLPSFSLVIESVVWVLLAQAVICTIAVGLASLTGSRAGSLTTLIGWQVIASRLLVQVTFLGSLRDLIPNVALGQLKPGDALPDASSLTMSVGVAVIVLALWALAWTAAGAWRTRTVDA
jgi:hypothetical protein